MGGEFAAFYSFSFAPYERLLKGDTVSDDEWAVVGTSDAEGQSADDNLRLPNDILCNDSSFPEVKSKPSAAATPGDTSQEDGDI